VSLPDNPTLYHAFAELGRVIRTIFILKYVSQPALRFGIRAAMTKIEAFQDFSGWIFFGGDKIIRSRDPLEYEKRIKYKDLYRRVAVRHRQCNHVAQCRGHD
jgi:TnpA family transposase